MTHQHPTACNRQQQTCVGTGLGWCATNKQASGCATHFLRHTPCPQPSALAHAQHTTLQPSALVCALQTVLGAAARGHSRHVQGNTQCARPCSCSPPDTRTHTHTAVGKKARNDPAIGSSLEPREGLAPVAWVCMPLLLNKGERRHTHTCTKTHIHVLNTRVRMHTQERT